MQTSDQLLQNKSKKRAVYRWLMQQSSKCRKWLMLSVMLGVIYGGLIIGQAYFLASIIYSVAILKMTRSALMLPLYWLLILITARSAVAWLREVVNCHSAIVVKQELRDRLTKHLVAVGPVRLATYSDGAISSTILEQVEGIHDFFANYLPQMMLVTILPILILVFIFPLNWLAGLILFITAPLIPLFMALIGMGAESKSQQQYQHLAKMSGHFLDVLRGLVTLKLFNQSLSQIKRIAEVSDEYRRRTMSVLRIAFMSSAILELFSSVSIAILAVYLGLGLLGLVQVGINHGGINLQNALFILLLAPEFYLPLRQLGIHYHARAQAIGAAEEMIKLLELQTNKEQNAPISFSLTRPPAIQFNAVEFSYNDDKTILQTVDLQIDAGEHVAIVGESGAGKSTLLNLLTGFIEPDQGVIQINQQDLQSINRTDWQRSVSWIGQNTRLIYGSIIENIVIAKPNATMDEILKAVEYANLDPWLNQLQDGLNTKIGDQNVGVSQGQLQRIALCRAFLKNTPLLLLDEPTANLDAQTAQTVLSALTQLGKNKTVITVTHREQTMLHADRLFILKVSKLQQLKKDQTSDDISNQQSEFVTDIL